MNPTITLPLSSLVHLLLGDNHYRPLDIKTAQLIAEASSGTETCHVQFYDHDGTRLYQPVLWNLHQWRISTDSWLAAKARSDKARDERFVFDENVKRTARVIARETGIEGDASIVVARRMLSQGKIKQLGLLGLTNIARSIDDI